MASIYFIGNNRPDDYYKISRKFNQAKIESYKLYRSTNQMWLGICSISSSMTTSMSRHVYVV